MSKYQPLTDHLAAHPEEEWRASFSELEAVLGFPLPKAARTGRTWWANDLDKSHSRAWTAHGWAVGDVDHAAERVVFRRGAASGAALVEAAGLGPLSEGAAAPPPIEPAAAAAWAEPAPQIARAPEELASLAAERPETPATPGETARAVASVRRPPNRAFASPAMVAAGVALVAVVGSALRRAARRRRA
jgi:hypothetical protein